MIDSDQLHTRLVVILSPDRAVRSLAYGWGPCSGCGR